MRIGIFFESSLQESTHMHTQDEGIGGFAGAGVAGAGVADAHSGSFQDTQDEMTDRFDAASQRIMIIAIVVGAVIVVGAIGGVVWYRRHSKRGSDRVLQEIDRIEDDGERQRARVDFLKNRYNAQLIRDGLMMS